MVQQGCCRHAGVTLRLSDLRLRESLTVSRAAILLLGWVTLPSITAGDNRAGATAIHSFDPRVKLVVLLCILVTVALLPSAIPVRLMFLVGFLFILGFSARLHLAPLLRRSLLTLPFTGPFAIILYLSGDAGRATSVLAKTYCSTLAVMVCLETTPFTDLVAAGAWLRFPSFLLEIVLLIYRYLFVLRAGAQAMQRSFASRAGKPGRLAIRASAGMVAVLFVRSAEKAERVHSAMVSRGFAGTLPPYDFQPLSGTAWVSLSTGVLVCFIAFLL